MESIINYLVMLGVAGFGIIAFLVNVCIIFITGYVCYKIAILIIKKIERFFNSDGDEIVR